MIRNDRPLVLSKRLKKRRCDWEELEGHITYRQALANAITAIENHLVPQRDKHERTVDTEQITFTKSRPDQFRGRMPNWGDGKASH